MTIFCIVVPSVIVNVMSVVQQKNVWSWLAGFLQLSIVVRYVEKIFGSDRNPLAFAKLRYVETIAESAPQWCLQGYVMLRRWYFPWYTILSIILSLLSLSWSITDVEITRRESTKWNCRNITEIVSFLLWQLFTLVSRLSAIVLFGYAFRYYVFMLFSLHLTLQSFFMLAHARERNQDANCSAKAFLSLLLISFPSIFHSPTSFAPKQIRKANMIVGYILITVENIAAVTLCFTIGIGIIAKKQGKTDDFYEPLPTSVPHIDTLEPLVIPILAATSFMSAIFIVIYYNLTDFDNAVDEQSH